MSDQSLNNTIRNAVFSELGIRLDSEDPVFTVVLANRMLLDQAGGAVQEAVREIPSAITAAIEKIVLAVEDSEKTVGSLRDETKGMLQAVARLEVENTHLHIKGQLAESAKTALEPSTRLLNSAISEAESKIKQMTSAARPTRLYLANVCLSVAMGVAMIAITVMGAAWYASYSDANSSAMHWYKLYSNQSAAIDGLPSNIKKQVTEAISSKK